MRHVDELLSDRRGLPIIPPPRGLRQGIEEAMNGSAPSPIPLELPWLRSTGWGGLVAAACVLLTIGVAGWFASVVPQHTLQSQPIAQIEPTVSTIDDSPAADELAPISLASLPRKAAPAAAAAQQPLMNEAEYLRRDTQRALGVVFSNLPISDRR